MDGKSLAFAAYFVAFGGVLLVVAFSRRGFDIIVAPGLKTRRRLGAKVFGEPDRTYEEQVALYRKLSAAVGVIFVLFGLAQFVGSF